MATKIKICDIRDISTARFCAQNKIDFIGLHHIYGILNEEKLELFKQIRSVSDSLKLVLVTRETNFNTLLINCLSFEFDYIQMHFPISSKEINNFKIQLRDRHCNSGLIAVISTDDIDYVDIDELYKEVDFLLFDTSYHGGTGVCSTDEVIKKITSKAKGKQFFFAGGLDPYNVEEKIKMLNPFAVDVQTGVEFDGGEHIKDFSKILSFVKKVKSINIAND